MNSPAEREELVVFTHDDTGARVYSFSPLVWGVCDRVKAVLQESHKRAGKEVSRDYLVPLDRLHLVLNRIGEIAKEKAARNGPKFSGAEKAA